MPSLLTLTLTVDGPQTFMPTKNPLSSDKFREIAYHLDGQGRYVAQSYEVRAPQSSSKPPLHVQSPHKGSRSASSQQCSGRAGLQKPNASHRKVPAVVVVQSRESSVHDQHNDDAMANRSLRSAVPPRAPRPDRLPTPELPELSEARPFCYCDSKRQYCTGAPCVAAPS